MTRHSRALAAWVVAVVVVAAAPAPAKEWPHDEQAQEDLWAGTPCADGQGGERADLRRLVWCDRDRPSVRQAALAAAPVLWFSPDEFLLDLHKRRCTVFEDHERKKRSEYPAWRGGLPEPFPWRQSEVDPLSHAECDKIPAGERVWPGVVYYCVSSRRAGECQRDAEAPVQAGEDGRVFVDYFYYFERDSGLNSHAHDLESTTFELSLRRYDPPEGAESGHWRLLIDRVKGEAHGLSNVANRLQVVPHLGVRADDLRVPVTLLIEEGKHASCPDRNGDGTYNPGYDVNFRTNDAWGVRDVFSQAVLVKRYDTSQTKPRLPDQRQFPFYPAADGARPTFRALRRAYSHVRPEQGWNCTRSYVLNCVEREQTQHFHEIARSSGPSHSATTRCDEKPSKSHPEPLSHRWNWWKRSNERAPLSYRYDGRHGISLLFPTSLTPPNWRLVAAPRVTLAGGTWPTLGLKGAEYASASLLFSPTMVSWLDWYGAVGHARLVDGLARRGHFVWEGGVRLRHKLLLLNNNLPILGVRLGARLQDLKRPRGLQLVFEVGGGWM